ncbi:MAG: DUF4065 domain-containing protein [Bdellovibrionales bacterium]|nr:DUF4065 domain-containing protein [Bdellovibrionales bacterium]
MYHEFKYSGINIKKLSDNFENLEIIQSDFNKEEKDIIEKFLEVYGNKTATELIAITHKKGSPWYKAWNEKGGKDILNFQIKNEDIKKYYKDKISKVKNKAS